jgi:SAM-dependent methyltransferase
VKRTTERHSPDRVRTVEDRVADALHRFAYSTVEAYARPADRLLEIGFGEGYGAPIVRGWVSEYVGVEVEPEPVGHALARYGGPGTEFLAYDGTTLPFDDDRFDLAISFQVVEHVRDPVRFLTEARRVVRPGGAVLVTTPNRNHRLEEGERPWNRYHVREFSPSELRELMDAVFDTVEIFGIHGSPRMETIERARVSKARRLARLDRFGLRYRLPESLDTRVRGAVRRRATTAAVADESDLGVEHVRHDADVETSLDLLAVGRA